MINIKRVQALMHKEWREIIRDKLFLSLAFIVPFSQMLVFGYGLIFDVENIPFAILDLDKTPMSREYVYRFINSPYFKFKKEVQREEELGELLARSEIRVGFIIPYHFEKNLRAGKAVEIQSLIDGVFPFRAATTKGYVLAINNDFNVEILTSHLSKSLGISPERARSMSQPVKAQIRYLYNQALKSIWSVSTVMIMFVLMTSPPFLTAMGIVKEKESGSIYNIYSSTVTPAEFLIGKLTPYVVISTTNSLILWTMATGLFGAPFKGSFTLFLVSSAIYVTCTTGIGLLVSILVQTQVAALMITVVLTIVPAVLYSGLIIPVASMEPAGQIQAHLFPTMYYTYIVHGSFLKGTGFLKLWDRIAILILYGIILWSLSYFLFRKRVEQ